MKSLARSLRHQMTDAERLLWHHLRAQQLDDFKFRRQLVTEPYIADFACLDAKLGSRPMGANMLNSKTGMRCERPTWKHWAIFSAAACPPSSNSASMRRTGARRHRQERRNAGLRGDDYRHHRSQVHRAGTARRQQASGRAREELENAKDIAAKSQFLSRMSHELRTLKWEPNPCLKYRPYRLMPPNQGLNSASYSIIEDSPMHISLVRDILANRPDIKVMAASTPTLGLELAVAHRPDLILLDINLPGLDGFEVMRRLRFYEVTRDIPVVAVSANAMPSDIECGRAAGFKEYVTKPIRVAEFRQLIDKMLTGRGADVA